MPADLTALLERVASGDREAFSALYQLSSSRLFRLATLVTGDEALAEEALQDAYLQIWHGASTYDASRGTPDTWMNVLVRRRCIDLLRREGRRQQHIVEAEWEHLPSSLPDPMAQAMLDHDARRLMVCMEGLDPSQRDALGMAYFHGLSHRELASRLSVPLGTLKSWIRRGLDRLDKCLHHEL